ncbi:cytosolic protein [Sphingomonas histidinilytica]|uniref:ketosteroid isomerase-related protein n=1 Tax=Rhizorhabdus histidinilytica TaxID=439228 RepID=UPI001ADC6C58|nr:ketosteroid isomerase-related protein [Rhizorhabdus histidinilytica]MBO9379651.1 cytosolic protein [Rhizorhabdus histidinilytica]
MSETLISRYYEAFNRGDSAGMLDLLTEDVVHEPSQGEPRHGKAAFAAFLDHMNSCYREQVIDPVFLSSPDGARAAAEFQLEGNYLHTDSDLPPAHGQRYLLRVGAFFDIADGRIARVSNHYNLANWLRQVSEPA